jgi:signal peptidase I
MATITLACLAIAGLAALWPTRLGGTVSYVTTHGTSMEPAFHQGDLAAVRASSTYRVGEVVAYRSRLLDTVVLHRIVVIDHGHYTFKGDNNSWQDAEHPVAADLIGRLWLHIRRGGWLLGWLHTPAYWPAAVVIALGAAAPIEARRRRRQRKRFPMPVRTSISTSAYSSARAAAAVLMACAVVFATLVAVTLARPTTTTREAKVPYTQRGTFKYTAAAAPSPAYDDGRADTGEPVYLRLANTVGINFAYEFDAEVGAMDGTLALRAELSDGSGWRRTIKLAAPMQFHGAHTEGTATLELPAVEALLAEVRTATGAGASTYTVDIIANVAVAGTLHGQRINSELASQLGFHLDAIRLAPETSMRDATSGYTTSTAGAVKVRTTSDSRLELFGRGTSVEAAKEIAIVGTAITAAAAASILLLIRRRRPGPTAHIAMRYGPRIIAVDAAEVGGHLVVFDVASIDDLARLAEQHACLILHQEKNGQDTYLFQADRTVYRYVLRTAAS